jgi:hypothetical protein
MKPDEMLETKDSYTCSALASPLDEDIGAAVYPSIDKLALKKYTWKCDLHLLPLLSTLYLLK